MENSSDGEMKQVKSMHQLPRGIAPELLVSQVKNTMPYLFEPQSPEEYALEGIPGAALIRGWTQSSSQQLTHVEYFKLCVSAHLLSCATPTPTDVDNQIRKKLWPENLPLEWALQMTDWVLEVRSWDFTLVSERFSRGAPGSEGESQVLGGHQGEWFTLAAAAYGALGQYSDPSALLKRGEVLQAISEEVKLHSEVFGSLWRAHQGLECLKAAANTAHNFGDLDRVMDMWELPLHDPLRVSFYKLTAQPLDAQGKLRYLGRLWVAGELYKSEIDGSSMALENHRHFALRKPKCLKQSRALLVPNGPFFDSWGVRVAQVLGTGEWSSSSAAVSSSISPSTSISSPILIEVIDALIQGWSRLPRTVGYGRALSGIFQVAPGLRSEKAQELKPYRKLLDLDQTRFEKKWNDQALAWMDEIPSRA